MQLGWQSNGRIDVRRVAENPSAAMDKNLLEL